MDFRNKKHIFFDLDHTLWDFDKNSELAFSKVFNEKKYEFCFESFIKNYTKINQEFWKLYQLDKISQEELKLGRLIETFKILDVSMSIDEIEEISKLYIRFLPLGTYLIEGTNQILEYLFPKYGLHIITNGFHEVQNHKLKNSAIDKYFSTITNSQIAGFKKPQREIFEYALTSANASISNSLMIGDSYEADVLGAKKIGLDVLFLDLNDEFDSINDVPKIKKLIDIIQFF